MEIPLAAVADVALGPSRPGWLHSWQTVAMTLAGTALILAGFVGVNVGQAEQDPAAATPSSLAGPTHADRLASPPLRCEPEQTPLLAGKGQEHDAPGQYKQDEPGQVRSVVKPRDAKGAGEGLQHARQAWVGRGRREAQQGEDSEQLQQLLGASDQSQGFSGDTGVWGGAGLGQRKRPGPGSFDGVEGVPPPAMQGVQAHEGLADAHLPHPAPASLVPVLGAAASGHTGGRAGSHGSSKEKDSGSEDG
ncbi:hypothetical protein V8C86DRAFT_3102687 [Haematococcus lacustris]